MLENGKKSNESEEQVVKKTSTQKICYCHFSFRRPRTNGWDGLGIFTAALFRDEDGSPKMRGPTMTRAFPLWVDHQHITAIQAYEHALRCIYEWQAELLRRGYTNILLVTDNSTLAGWILNPSKNKAYTKTMLRANEVYARGCAKEIRIDIGLCKPRDTEKSHKFCLEGNVSNLRDVKAHRDGGIKGVAKLDFGSEFQSVTSLLEEDTPESIEGIVQLDI